MNTPSLLKYSFAGLGIVAALVALVLLINRPSQARLEGSVLKVRIVPTDDNSALAVMEVRLKNPANAQFMVQEVGTAVHLPGGEVVEARPVSEMDLDRVLEYNKLAGPKYNPTLKAKERLGRDQTIDRTVAASFALAAEKLARRERFVLRILEVDGATAVIEENRR